MYTVDKQYKRDVTFYYSNNKFAKVTAAGNMNVHEFFFYLICVIFVILMFRFLT